MNVEKSFCAVSEKLLVDFTSKVFKVELCDETFLLKCVFNFNFASLAIKAGLKNHDVCRVSKLNSF